MLCPVVSNFITKISTWIFQNKPSKKQRLLDREYEGISILWNKAQELISGLDLATRAWLLSFNRTQSGVVIGLLTGHNTLRHLYIMGLCNNPTCRKCSTEETSVHILCECEALASFIQTYLGSFFLDSEDIRKLSIRAVWYFANGTGLL